MFFIDVEIMWTLCLMDRYKYFNTFMPKLIQKIDHYNDTINESAYTAINEIIESGNNRALEARVVFTTLRKILFLSPNGFKLNKNLLFTNSSIFEYDKIEKFENSKKDFFENLEDQIKIIKDLNNDFNLNEKKLIIYRQSSD